MATTEQVKAAIEGIEGVKSVNLWEKAGHCRLYIDLPKPNGGRSWNGGRAVTLYLDLNNGQVVCKGDWAGAKTETAGEPIIANIKSVVAALAAEKETVTAVAQTTEAPALTPEQQFFAEGLTALQADVLDEIEEYIEQGDARFLVRKAAYETIVARGGAAWLAQRFLRWQEGIDQVLGEE